MLDSVDTEATELLLGAENNAENRGQDRLFSTSVVEAWSDLDVLEQTCLE